MLRRNNCLAFDQVQTLALIKVTFATLLQGRKPKLYNRATREGSGLLCMCSAGEKNELAGPHHRSCKDNKACYTIDSTVGCYSSASQRPTNEKTCVPSGKPNCENDDCIYCLSDVFKSCAEIVYIDSYRTLTSAICAEAATEVPFTSETTVELVTTPAYTTAAVSGDKDTPTTTLGMAPILGITIGVSALPLLLVIITMLLRRKSGATIEELGIGNSFESRYIERGLATGGGHSLI
ncbi:uncharacterized protein LAJ45_05174 [Morchella importuna]|uniref:uncharacterized protein n=1 Tax=Morchella importuna TaxID=1174673 RepID=UPI001E8D7F03|nr:uncharacterized protein LAJ45_05174 [Morchella importuna]KAH8150991.1 hypothetical protein LAJ45_05174 [Morchella importuna]